MEMRQRIFFFLLDNDADFKLIGKGEEEIKSSYCVHTYFHHKHFNTKHSHSGAGQHTMVLSYKMSTESDEFDEFLCL